MTEVVKLIVEHAVIGSALICGALIAWGVWEIAGKLGDLVEEVKKCKI